MGVAACHVRSLDGLDEIYGDLLLHDLGPELADPVAAEFAVVLVKREDLRLFPMDHGNLLNIATQFLNVTPQLMLVGVTRKRVD